MRHLITGPNLHSVQQLVGSIIKMRNHPVEKGKDVRKLTVTCI